MSGFRLCVPHPLYAPVNYLILFFFFYLVVKSITNKSKELSSHTLKSNCANNLSNSDFFRHYNSVLNRIDIIINSVEDNNNNNRTSNNDNKIHLRKNGITITRTNESNGQNSEPSSLQKAQDYVTISRVVKKKN